MNFDALDYTLIAVYFVGVLLVSYTRKPVQDILLAGRKIPLRPLAISLAVTWYGGVLGIGEFTYSFGVNTWWTQAFPYYVFALIYALWLLPSVWSSEDRTLSERIELNYGPRCASIASLAILILSSPAPYALMMGTLWTLIFPGSPLWFGTLMGLILASLFLNRGGLLKDVRSDQYDFIFMYASFFVLVAYCLVKLGTPSEMWNLLPEMHKQPRAGQSWGFMAVWFGIAVWTWIDPSFFQRVKAAPSILTAKKTILIALGCWILFDLLTVAAGLYGRAFLPGNIDPTRTYPILADRLLPAGLKGLFWAGMAATVLSTLNSSLLVSSFTMTEQFGRLGLKPKPWLGLCLSILAALALALLVPSVVGLWFVIGSACVPVVLPPFLCSLRRIHFKFGHMFMAQFLGGSLSLTWIIVGWTREFGSYDAFPMDVQPMFAGLTASIVVLVGSKITNHKFLRLSD